MDRLSALPDSLLIHILSLSFPDVQRASITCVLSKRWQFLWAEFPRLRFQGTRVNTDEKRAIFVAWINRALATRAKYAEEFNVSLEYDNRLTCDVDAWVEFVVRNKVKEFSLGLNSRKYLYMIPEMLYSTSSLTNLQLRHCIVAPLKTVKWKSLTKLEIVGAKLNGVEKISGCPVLHTLNLIHSWGFTRLEINSPSLYKLWVEVRGCRCRKDDALLEISAPYLHSLSITYYANRRKLVLLNISSLVSASIDFAGNYGIEGYDWNSIKELFEGTRHVKELELGMKCFQVIVSLLAVSDWQLPRSSRVSLRLTIDRHRDYMSTISGIVSILESSPMLETLVIRGRTYYDHYFLEDYRDSGAMVDLDGDLMHLKRVKMVSFVSPTIARMLLKRAIILEEMIILEDTHLRKKALLLGPQLLTYPKSSHKALVRFQFY